MVEQSPCLENSSFLKTEFHSQRARRALHMKEITDYFSRKVSSWKAEGWTNTGREGVKEMTSGEKRGNTRSGGPKLHFPGSHGRFRRSRQSPRSRPCRTSTTPRSTRTAAKCPTMQQQRLPPARPSCWATTTLTCARGGEKTQAAVPPRPQATWPARIMWLRRLAAEVRYPGNWLRSPPTPPPLGPSGKARNSEAKVGEAWVLVSRPVQPRPDCAQTCFLGPWVSGQSPPPFWLLGRLCLLADAKGAFPGAGYS